MPIEISESGGKKQVLIKSDESHQLANISVSVFDLESHGWLLLIGEEEIWNEIGSRLELNRNLADYTDRDCVGIHFEKLESVEVMLKMLNYVREQMIRRSSF